MCYMHLVCFSSPNSTIYKSIVQYSPHNNNKNIFILSKLKHWPKMHHSIKFQNRKFNYLFNKTLYWVTVSRMCCSIRSISLQRSFQDGTLNELWNAVFRSDLILCQWIHTQDGFDIASMTIRFRTHTFRVTDCKQRAENISYLFRI